MGNISTMPYNYRINDRLHTYHSVVIKRKYRFLTKIRKITKNITSQKQAYLFKWRGVKQGITKQGYKQDIHLRKTNRHSKRRASMKT